MKSLIVYLSYFLLLVATFAYSEQISIHAYANGYGSKVLKLDDASNTIQDLAKEYCSQENVKDCKADSIKVIPMIIGGAHKPFELSQTIKEAGIKDNQHVKIIPS